LDFDCTDDRVHGLQEGRPFHGFYYDFCFLPLYVFCREQLLVSYLRQSNIEWARAQVGAIRLRLLKIGAVITRNTRRICLRLSSSFPLQQLFCSCLARFSANHLPINTKRVSPLRKPPHGAKSGLGLRHCCIDRGDVTTSALGNQQ
jgi:hypothetical protein